MFVVFDNYVETQINTYKNKALFDDYPDISIIHETLKLLKPVIT